MLDETVRECKHDISMQMINIEYTLYLIVAFIVFLMVAVVGFGSAIYDEQVRHNKLMEEVAIHEKVEKTLKQAEADHK